MMYSNIGLSFRETLPLIKGQWENCIWKFQRLPHICLWKCTVLSKYWVRRAAYFEIIERTMLTSKYSADFVMQKSFKGRSTQPGTNALNILLWKNDAQQNRCTISMWTGIFPSTRHTELNSLKEPCTFKGKCAVNAENFICNLLTGPLVKMIFLKFLQWF